MVDYPKNNPQSNISKTLLKLTVALIASGTLNIAFLVVICSYYFADAQLPPHIDRRPVVDGNHQPSLALKQSFQQVMRALLKLPFEQLLECLHRTELVENGYRIRDLALALLISNYHFDGERALSMCGCHKQLRTMQLSHYNNPSNAQNEGHQIVLISGLTDEHYQSIIQFANTEKWPLTPKGLFSQLKATKGNLANDLKEAFCLTPHYFSAFTLLSRSNGVVAVDDLINILVEGSWEMLDEFHSQQKHSQDLSAARRQRFLLDYVECFSTAASTLIVELEGDFVLRKLDNDHVITILKHALKTKKMNTLALSLLKSPRCDAVWEAAADFLYQSAKLTKPAQLDIKATLALFDPASSKIAEKTSQTCCNKPQQPLFVKKDLSSISAPKILSETSSKITSTKRGLSLYIIQSGDSLWKIAKRFHVDIDAIRRCNHLINDNLKPGSPLAIPLPEK